MLRPTDSACCANDEEALTVNCASDLQWSDEADVVVVGFGGAGVSTAIEARDCGASVIAIDRFQGGGATAMSGGVCYLGAGTKQQHDAGLKDSTEQMFRYLQMETQGVVKDETLHHFCNNSVETHHWLEENGVKFSTLMSPVKTSYPAKQYHLYYSGNETVPEYAAKADPAPRGHRIVGSGLTGSGAALYSALQKSALAKGVKLKTQSRATRLVINAKGEVIGVEVFRFPDAKPNTLKHRLFAFIAAKTRLTAPALAKHFTSRLRQLEHNNHQLKRELIRAHKGLILSAGGFIHNREMIKHYAPKYQSAMPLGSTGCNGSGIRLGQSIGGAVDHMERISAWRFINPPLAWAKGIVVNDQGKRYCNEQVYGAKLGYHMVEENDGRATVVINRVLLMEALKQTLSWEIWYFQAIPVLLTFLFKTKKGKTIEELARKCGMPVSNLKATIESYNQAANGDRTDEFGKGKDFLSGLNCGPYYAYDVSIDSKTLPCATVTFGGLVVDEQSGQVKNQEGNTIKGLYAAGRTAIGIPSNFYVSGLSIADCIFSGRRAGHHCASL